MSIILDALRKSENERQRGTPPGLADARYIASPDRRSFWIPIVFTVLLANLILMGWWWYQSESGDPSSQVSTPPQALPNAPGNERRFEPPATQVGIQSPAVRSLHQEAASPQPPAVNQPVTQSLNRRAGMPAPDTPQQAPEPVDLPSAGLPDLTELTLSGDIVLPPMHIDLHVYSSNPVSRLVFINGDQYREGDRLQEGPEIAAITPAGVILKHQGRQFTLPKE